MENRDTDTSSKCSNMEMLCDAALQGDVKLLLQLVEKDPYILHRPSGMVSVLPLHLASRLGHVSFAEQVLRLRPDLISAVDESSSTPLHIASRNGHLDMVRCLVAAAKPGICLVRDNQGRNPVHVAAEQGHIEVVLVLAEAFPAAARERVVRSCYGVAGGSCRDGDTTILHLCVKQANLEMLKLIVEKVLCDDDGEIMLNFGDGDGNTILHWAVILKQLEMIEYLLADKRIEKNARNSNNRTPMDILFSHHKRPAAANRLDIQIKNKLELDIQIKNKLEQAKALRSADLWLSILTRDRMGLGSWIEKQQSGLMVVASLITTMAFQACINPPAYLVQLKIDDMKGHSLRNYLALIYKYTNGIGFISSICSMFLLISGLRFSKIRVSLLSIAVFVAVAAMLVVYQISAVILTEIGRYPKETYIVLVITLIVLEISGLVIVLAWDWVIQVARLLAWDWVIQVARLLRRRLRRGPPFSGQAPN